MDLLNLLPNHRFLPQTKPLKFQRSNLQFILNSSTLNESTSSSSQNLEESLKVLKNAAQTRRVPHSDVLSALAAVKQAKAPPTRFLETLGGTESPGRTWMLIFTAQGKLDKGRYFPITAIQRFDAAIQAMRKVKKPVAIVSLGLGGGLNSMCSHPTYSGSNSTIQ